jgi:PEP-CTERM motif
VFNATTFVFGSGAEATLASSSTSTTYTNSIQWNVNTSMLPSGSGHDLDVGLVSASTSGTGFTSLTFSVEEDAATVLTKTFTSLTAANTYLTDDLANLGEWTSGSTLDVLASLSVTAAGSGNGYGINYLVGVDPPASRAAVPEPATWCVFGFGLLGLGWSKLRRHARV